jgi:hypothetical protein
MPEFTVKTFDDRNLVIEADRYTRNSTYDIEFLKDGNLVATIPNNTPILAIVANEAEKSDHYHVYDWNEEDAKEEVENSDDVCLDCRNEEFLNSEEFWNAVWEIAWDVAEAWNSPPEEETEPAEVIQ